MMPIQHFYFHFLKRKWARPKEHDQGKNMHIQNKKKYKYEISEEEKKTVQNIIGPTWIRSLPITYNVHKRTIRKW